MQLGSIDRRYAKALMELAQEDDLVDAVFEDLKRFNELLEGSHELREVLTRRSYSSLEQEQVLRDVLGRLSPRDLTQRFLCLLVRRHRLDQFDGIMREFSNSYDELKGNIRVEVTTSTALEEDLENLLVAQIEGFTKKKVLISKTEDPGIIGGVVTRVGDLLFAGSLSTQLNRMSATLLRERTD